MWHFPCEGNYWNRKPERVELNAFESNNMVLMQDLGLSREQMPGFVGSLSPVIPSRSGCERLRGKQHVCLSKGGVFLSAWMLAAIASKASDFCKWIKQVGYRLRDVPENGMKSNFPTVGGWKELYVKNCQNKEWNCASSPFINLYHFYFTKVTLFQLGFCLTFS